MLHFIIFIWGFTAVLGALISLDALPLTWYRLLIAWGFLLFFILWRRYPLRHYRPEDYKRFLFNGMLIGLHWLLFFKAIKTGGVSVTLVALSSGAFFTGLLEPLLFNRKISVYEILTGLAVIGIMYFIFRVNDVSWAAVFYGMSAAFAGSLFSVVNARLIRQYPAVTLSFFELFFAWVMISIILLLSGYGVSPPQLSATDWLWLMLLGSVCTAYAFTVSLELLRKISPFTLILSINLEPVYGMVLAYLIFGEKERMSWNFYLGALLILLLVAWEGWWKYRKNKSTQ